MLKKFIANMKSHWYNKLARDPKIVMTIEFTPFTMCENDNITDTNLAEQYASMIVNDVKQYAKEDTHIHYSIYVKR